MSPAPCCEIGLRDFDPNRAPRLGQARRDESALRQSHELGNAKVEEIVTYYFAVEAHHKIIGLAVRRLVGFRGRCAASAFPALEKRTCPPARALTRSVSRLGGLS